MRLRSIHTERRGKVTKPQLSDLHREINEVLLHAPIAFSHQNIEVRSHEAASPHTPDGFHDVFWLNVPQENEAVFWNESAETEVLSRLDFWQTCEEFIRAQLSAHNSHTRAYMNWGFAHPDEGERLSYAIRYGLQSQARLHFHIADAIETDRADSWLDMENDRHASMISRICNFAGEKMGEMVLSDQVFGQRFIYEQKLLGNEPEQKVTRTLYAFPSLAEAIQASAELKSAVEEQWLLLAFVLTHAEAPVFSGRALRLLQSTVPNFVFILPSEKDKERAGRANQEVWVSPFAVAGTPELLTDGGVYLDRR